MWTIHYKGWFIHGYTNKPQCFVGFPGYVSHELKSLHAAKCWITRQLRGNVNHA